MENAVIPSHVPADLVRDFNIFDFEGSSENVHRAWRKVGENEPAIFYTPVFGGYWVLNRAALLEQAWPDAEIFESGKGIGIPPTPKEFPPQLPIESDDPFHRMVRHPLNIALSPKAVSQLAATARQLAIDLIDGIAPQGNCDFVDDFSLIMPMEVFLKIVDLPSTDRPYLLGLTYDAIKNPDVDRRFASTREMFDYVDGWVRKRAETPGSDLISTIVTMTADGRPLTHSERVGYVVQIMFGGLDTVGGTMALIIKHLAEHPDDRKYIAENLGKNPGIIEELLRRYSIPTVARTLSRDVDFHGVTMKQGDRIMLPTMVHGLDERRWENAMEIDFERQPRDHMAFGKGTHRCPGANLARAEIRIMLEEWLKRIPDFSLNAEKPVRYQSGSVAGLVTLPLVWPTR
ncbi:cytochrome P450 [Novosphingobium sp. G106]|uniref:cytochrome P450 n=1 Tax=Novosphingobium sp. G106 TaxID=2849500 RepID=UPI001C2DD0E9|nr:cytochrome P450 [Novosphingobium sp. G106]MBV1688925.1 cytochrome P450 [Novosphingobium sp. G106]